MSKVVRVGASCLLAGPLVALVALIVLPTASDEASDQVAALTDHHGSMIAGMTLQTLSIVIMLGGVVWLATALVGRSPRLAVSGGILGVAGALVILFEDGLSAATPAIVHVLDPARAGTVVDRLDSSPAAHLEPLALLFSIGVALLGFAAVRAGTPRWVAVAVALGAFAQGIGFAIGSRPVAAASFVVLFAGLAGVVRALAAHVDWQPMRGEAVSIA